MGTNLKISESILPCTKGQPCFFSHLSLNLSSVLCLFSPNLCVIYIVCALGCKRCWNASKCRQYRLQQLLFSCWHAACTSWSVSTRNTPIKEQNPKIHKVLHLGHQLQSVVGNPTQKHLIYSDTHTRIMAKHTFKTVIQRHERYKQYLTVIVATPW